MQPPGRGGVGQRGAPGSVRMGLRVRAFIVVSAGRNGGSGNSRLGLTDLDTFSRSWGITAVPGSQVLGPGVIRTLSMSSTDEVVRNSDSRFIALHTPS